MAVTLVGAADERAKSQQYRAWQSQGRGNLSHLDSGSEICASAWARFVSLYALSAFTTYFLS